MPQECGGGASIHSPQVDDWLLTLAFAWLLARDETTFFLLLLALAGALFPPHTTHTNSTSTPKIPTRGKTPASAADRPRPPRKNVLLEPGRGTLPPLPAR